MSGAFVGRPGDSHPPTTFTTCLSCGRPIPRGRSYCTEHQPKRRSAALRGGGATIARFRRDTLLLAGTRCEAVVDGVRCDVTDETRLEAHHLRAVSAGGSNLARLNGICLCRYHHALIEGRKLAESA